ncbi:MAG: 2-hydroxyacyl-CoA dehydratase, partial [Candidatus Tectomicrobia bacterium]|nr:2-hydroxyacyl-CoA dehydratase [Candidatus Tectomicrobia bacterium]
LLADPLYLELIEAQGAVVVADELCTGSRYASPQLDLQGEPLEALSRGYLESVPCSRMMDRKRRFEAILRMVEECQVDGVIYSVLKFCQTYQYDFPHLESCLKERGIPLLKLEREYTLSGAGQMSSRVQAFLEMLSAL